MRNKWITICIIMSALLLISMTPPQAHRPAGKTSLDYKPGEVIVIMKQGAGWDGIRRNPRLDGLRLQKKYPHLSREREREYLVLSTRHMDHMSDKEIEAELQRDPDIEAASLNYIRKLFRKPNDPRFQEQWGLHNTGQTGFSGSNDKDIDAPEAWEKSTGSSNVVVAVIDTGVDFFHQDLKGNIWKNPGEIPGNNQDDDNNGYVDDYYGYNFTNDHVGANPHDPMDGDGHGTEVSGVIGARGNNGIGVTGVNWNVRIMGLRVFNKSLDVYLSDEINAFEYLVMMKTRYNVNIVAANCSFGGGNYTEVEKTAIGDMGRVGIITCAAAGNETSDNDQNPTYPSDYNVQGLISVAATQPNDTLASFSNWGKNSVHIAAPGDLIKTTALTGSGRESTLLINGDRFIALGMTFGGTTSGISRNIYYCKKGLEAGDFPAAVNGNIALIERGVSYFREKVANAQQAGAVAAIIYNNLDGIFTGTLEYSNNWIPAISISRADGQRIRNMGNPTATVTSSTSNYSYGSGTSVAAPFVSGAVAIMAARFPNDSTEERMFRVLLGNDQVGHFSDKIMTGSRLNISDSSIKAPINITGERKVNKSFLFSEYVDVITWQPNPQSQNITGYVVYTLENNRLVKVDEVDASVTEVFKNTVPEEGTLTYAIVGKNSNGLTGEPATVTITSP